VLLHTAVPLAILSRVAFVLMSVCTECHQLSATAGKQFGLLLKLREFGEIRDIETDLQRGAGEG